MVSFEKNKKIKTNDKINQFFRVYPEPCCWTFSRFEHCALTDKKIVWFSLISLYFINFFVQLVSVYTELDTLESSISRLTIYFIRYLDISISRYLVSVVCGKQTAAIWSQGICGYPNSKVLTVDIKINWLGSGISKTKVPSCVHLENIFLVLCVLRSAEVAKLMICFS